jgi:uncharacterized protein with HEPN domain
MSRRDPLVAIHHMLDHANDGIELAQNYSRTDLDSDRMFNLAMRKVIEIIGEAARRVPDDFRSLYPEVPWQGTADMRNRLVHGYDVVDLDIVWGIIKDELPPLAAQLTVILSEQGANQNGPR